MKIWKLKTDEIELITKSNAQEKIKAGIIGVLSSELSENRIGLSPVWNTYDNTLDDENFHSELERIIKILVKNRKGPGPFYDRRHLERYLILHPVFKLKVKDNTYGFRISSKNNTFLFKFDYKPGRKNVIIYCFKNEKLSNYFLWRCL